jgi:hypothetical protein
MALLATSSGGGDFELTPEGTYIGRCYRIIDLGTQHSERYGNDSHKVMVSWELLGADVAKMEDGRPFSVHQTYTVSLGEKANLRAHLEAWRGKKFTPEELAGFDLANVLGKYCMIQVVHNESNGTTYANINAIMSYKGDEPSPVNPNVLFDIDNPDMNVFNSLSESMKAKIMAAPEWEDKPVTGDQHGRTVVPVPNTQPISNKTEITKETLDEVFPVEDDEKIDLKDIPF